MNRTHVRRRGFTLIEILVGVAILAILSAALTPLVIKYINDGRRARALSDSQTLGQAILAFNLDTGMWPVNDDANLNDAGELSRLVGLPAVDINAANIPNGTGAPGAGNWGEGSPVHSSSSARVRPGSAASSGRMANAAEKRWVIACSAEVASSKCSGVAAYSSTNCRYGQ